MKPDSIQKKEIKRVGAFENLQPKQKKIII
jgi:hypothetical protein